jgi:hypothetical protein
LVERARDLKDRLYLIVLLLIGAAAIASGLYYLLALGDISAPIIFDTAFGVAILLVAWLFLVPESVPAGADRLPARLTQIEPQEPPRTVIVRGPEVVPRAPPAPSPPPREAPTALPSLAALESFVRAHVSETTATPTPRARPPPPEEPPPPTVPASEVIKELDEIYEDLQPAEPEKDAPPLLDPRRRRFGGPATG